MIRISGGNLRGRYIKSPGTRHTRPTGAKVRQAVFNIIGNIDGFALDLYAGSGIMGFEALSRGEDRVDFVEKAPQANTLIKANAKSLDLFDFCQIWNMSVELWLKKQKEQNKASKYDFIYADPPYLDQYPDIRPFLALRKSGGVAVFEMPSRNLPPWSDESTEIRRYGESTLALFF